MKAKHLLQNIFSEVSKKMNSNYTSNLKYFFDKHRKDIALLRQNHLQGEGGFIAFAKGHGIPAAGVTTGDPGFFHDRAWLASDDRDCQGQPMFHPFRIITLWNILESCKLKISTSSTVKRESLKTLIKLAISTIPNDSQIAERAHRHDGIVDLAILLEPIYWPLITGRTVIPATLDKENYYAKLENYRKAALQLVESLDPVAWRKIHEELRFNACLLDENHDLYLMLRFCKWSKRERLKGKLAGALWFRHIAEVIRRAFEEVRTEQWLEEDIAFSTWRTNGRTFQYGSERPIDDELKSIPYIVSDYGLFTGSVIRWYVEGDTEYFAVLGVIPEPSKIGVELINLRGNIETDKANIAFKLRDALEGDKSLRRFSMISFDGDVGANVKLIKRQVEQENLVGYIALHEPDFEFSNFTVQELAEVAASIDEENGASGEGLRNADWTGIKSAKDFETKYVEISDRKNPSIKGKEWGKALATYAIEHPNRRDDGNERPFLNEIRVALRARFSKYDLQKDNFTFSPDGFKLIRKALELY